MKSIGQMAGARLPRRVAVRLARMGSAPGALVWQPPPQVAGDPAVARGLVNGVLLFEGRLVETRAPLPWEIAAPDRVWEAALHGHGWLDDAAAAGDPAHWQYLSAWVWDWLDRFGDGTGPGWEPDVTARRLTRWIAHSVRLLRGQPSIHSAAFFAALGMQARYVDWRWRDTADGAGRIEALAGLVYARLSLEGSGSATDAAITALGREAARIVGPDGAIPSRSPEELARIVALLAWSRGSIEDAGLAPAPGHAPALQRAAAVTERLRHPSGALARFHGGRPGIDLPEAARLSPDALHADLPGPAPMGYRRLEAGPGMLLVDTALPPSGPHATTAHASALAFEFSYGPLPMVVNAGSGLGFGARAGHAARRGEAHSGIELGGRCPARLIEAADPAEPARLVTEGTVSARAERDATGAWLMGESTLYESWFGLKIERRLHLSADGRRLTGEDTALATRAETRARRRPPAGADGATGASGAKETAKALTLVVRLRLHPDIRATPAMGGRAAALALPDGSTWMIVADSAELTIRPADYHDETRPKPRAAQQIVASMPVLDYWGRITWSLERLPDTRPQDRRDRAAT